MAGSDGFQGASQVVEGLDIVEFGRADERGDDRPCPAAFVMAGEERIFARQDNRSLSIFDRVAVRKHQSLHKRRYSVSVMLPQPASGRSREVRRLRTPADALAASWVSR